jgi:hypothetical protein
LPNCAVSRARYAPGHPRQDDQCATLALLHDGTIAEAHRADAGGALAVLIAPGPPLSASSPGGAEQRRERPGERDAAGRCSLICRRAAAAILPTSIARPTVRSAGG